MDGGELQDVGSTEVMHTTNERRWENGSMFATKVDLFDLTHVVCNINSFEYSCVVPAMIRGTRIFVAFRPLVNHAASWDTCFCARNLIDVSAVHRIRNWQDGIMTMK